MNLLNHLRFRSAWSPTWVVILLLASSWSQPLEAADASQARPRERGPRPQSPSRSEGAAETTPASAAGSGFEAFRLISERNIFNPNRRPPRASGTRPEPQPTRVDTFSLVGTLIYEEGIYAFFDGSESRYRTALKPSGTIAGFTLVDVAPNYVTLTSSSNKIELSMGMHLKKQDEGEWQLVADAVPVVPPSDTAAAGSEPTSSAGAASGGPADDVLKRLMQKREQELNK